MKPKLKVIKDFGQWSVTSYGLECLKPFHYHINKSALRTEENYKFWLDHIPQKNWCDIRSFKPALKAAVKFHARPKQLEIPFPKTNPNERLKK